MCKPRGGHESTFSDLACGCDSNGSTATECDSNGKCTCKLGFNGVKCDQCANGYSGYPNCKSQSIPMLIPTWS